MPAMDCDRLREVLIEHVDGLLGAGEAEGARAHLAACPPCRALQEEVRRGFSALDAWEEEELPDGAYQRLLARLPAGPSTPFGGPEGGPPRRPWLRTLTVAAVPYAAGAVTAAAAVLYLLPGGSAEVPGVPAGAGADARSKVVAPAPAPLPAARAGSGASLAGAPAGPRLRAGERPLLFQDYDHGVLRTVNLPEGLDPGKVILLNDRAPVVEPAGGVR